MNVCYNAIDDASGETLAFGLFNKARLGRLAFQLKFAEFCPGNV